MTKEKAPFPHHIEFFKEVVALARRHKMDSITLKFHDAFLVAEDQRSYLGFEGVWHSGRHGSDGVLKLKWNADLHIQEGEN